MSTTERHTLPELARRAKISESTARRYAKEFANYLPSEQRDRVRVYRAECVEIMQRVRDLYAAGTTTDQVHEVLQKEFPQVVEVSHQQQPQSAQPSVSSAQDIVQELLQQLRAGQQKSLPDPQGLDQILSRLDDLERRVEALEKKESQGWLARFRRQNKSAT